MLVREGARKLAGVGDATEKKSAAVGPRGWAAPPPNAKYPLAHVRREDVEPESVAMMSEVLKALRPFPEARGAVRARFAELFRDVP